LFESIEDVREKLAQQEYVCDRRLATVIYLAVKLDNPVRIEGPAGVAEDLVRARV
jgi:MoxR-like ATPase